MNELVNHLGASQRGILREKPFNFEASLGAFKSRLSSKKCCQGCKNGQPGQNESCKAKLLMEQLEKNKTSTIKTDV
ncbi:MAG: hypothetical protein ACI9Y7_000385 [Dokdonia sp.]|jgi:hypothetical protein